MRIGSLEIRKQPTAERLEGETAGGVATVGTANLYDVVGSSAAVVIADVQWNDGSRDIRTVSRCQSPDGFDDIVDRLRIGVHWAGDGRCTMRLRFPRRRELHRLPTLVQTTTDQLNEACGFDIADALVGAGADGVGTRQDLLSDVDRTRNELCVVFDATAPHVPAVAYAITPLAVLWEQLL